VSPYNFHASECILTKLFPGDVPGGEGDKMGVTFWKACPLKFGRVKNVQNSERFLTTFDFDREYLRNASTYCKQEKNFINQSLFHV